MPISNRIIHIFLHNVKHLNIYTENEMAKIKYSLQTFLYEIEKIIILLIVFAFMNQADCFLICLIVLFTIRINAGGYHSETNLSCLLFTFSVFFAAINVFPNFHFVYSKYGFALGSLMITIVLAPIFSLQKKKILKVNVINKKIITFIITAFWLTLFFYLDNEYTIPVLGIIVLQNMQLLFEYIRQRRVAHEIQK